MFSCNVQNEHLFTSVTLTWSPWCLNLSTLTQIYIAMGTRKAFLEQGLRTHNKFNAMYAFTFTVFKPGIHSPCWKVHAVTLPSAIPPTLVLPSNQTFIILLNPSTIDEHGKWCLKKVEPQDKQSRLHRVSMTICEREPPGTVTLNISEN